MIVGDELRQNRHCRVCRTPQRRLVRLGFASLRLSVAGDDEAGAGGGLTSLTPVRLALRVSKRHEIASRLPSQLGSLAGVGYNQQLHAGRALLASAFGSSFAANHSS